MGTEKNTTNIAGGRACRYALGMVLAATLASAACTRAEPPRSTASAARPSILLVTLDTTRADAIGPERAASRRRASTRSRRAAGASAGLRDGARNAAVAQLDDDRPLSGRPRRARERALPGRHAPVACRTAEAGRLSHAAFVSSFILARRFGLARGFDVYDDKLAAGAVERTRARRRIARSRRSRSPRRNRCFSGCTTSIRTHPTRRRAASASSTPRARISARSRRWTSRWRGWCRRSSGTRALGGTAAVVDRRRPR